MSTYILDGLAAEVIQLIMDLLTKTYGLKYDYMSMTYLYDEGTISYRGSTGNIKEKEKKKTVNYSGGKRTQFILTQRGQINTAKEHYHLESGNDRTRRLHHLLLEALNDSLETNLSTLPLYMIPLSIGISPQPSICYQRYFQF